MAKTAVLMIALANTAAGAWHIGNIYSQIPELRALRVHHNGRCTRVVRAGGDTYFITIAQ